MPMKCSAGSKSASFSWIDIRASTSPVVKLSIASSCSWVRVFCGSSIPASISRLLLDMLRILQTEGSAERLVHKKARRADYIERHHTCQGYDHISSGFLSEATKLNLATLLVILYAGATLPNLFTQNEEQSSGSLSWPVAPAHKKPQVPLRSAPRKH